MVNSAAGRKKSGNIALVVDERLTRDRRGVLSRVISSTRHFADVQIINGEVTEEELIFRLQKESFSLVLAPWHQYFKWSKVEAFYGLTRSSGPTFAGYVCDPIDPHEIGQQTSALRTICLDFADTHPHEAALLIQSLMQESRRTGIRPLLDPTASVYCENWYAGQGLGSRTDSVMALSEIAGTEWALRASPIRLILGALWSLVYEEGSGKSELTQAINGAKTPRAYFQLGCDPKTLVFRLWYLSPGSTAKGALTSFWPDPARPTAASQLLLKYADFLRVHTVTNGQEVEITTGLFKSAAADKAHRRLHSFWIEPVSPSLITEVPFEAPGPDAPHLKTLPQAPASEFGKPRVAPGGGAETEDKAKERFIFEAAVKIRDLKKTLTEREELIHDLKAGGVGTAAPLPPPDAEGLLEAFQQKYFESRFQIRQFEIQIAEMEQKGATAQEVETLRVKMSALASREDAWIRMLTGTLKSYRDAKKAADGSG